ncbi:MAG: NAD-dependent epimerase/dehydratase family protein [Gemmatimonadota bacterium]|nr:NAD-dependent epimerase/dehydratase family protein [Gemmatimonadota bacterium]
MSQTTPKAMRVLILGGTGFIGPHMVRRLQAGGHEVTLFNRGRSNPGLFPGVETLIGDRDGQLDALRGNNWDLVIDNSGYVPRHVRDSAQLLQDSVGRYIFTSTGSVYAFDQDEITEDGTLLPIEEPESEDVNRYYGPLKILCENAVLDAFGDRGTIVRLHVVAGPGDPTDRYTYWPVRIARGGTVIAPGSRTTPVQYIDVRDLADFMTHLGEQDTPGTFNAAGPTLAEMGMEPFLYGVRAITSEAVGFEWIDSEFLAERRAAFPLWYGEGEEMRGISRIRAHRGVEAGLRYRPLAVTAMDTLEWFRSEPEERQDEFGLNLERDAEIVEAWRSRG